MTYHSLRSATYIGKTFLVSNTKNDLIDLAKETREKVPKRSKEILECLS
jgi:hypothetical protein